MHPETASNQVPPRATTPTSATEPRAHERVPLEIEVTLEGEHNFFAGLSENISEGGLFIATHRLQKVGSRIALEFTLPGRAEPIRMNGEVRWLRIYNESSDTPPGMGVRFIDLDDETTAMIAAFIQHRAPLFWDDD